MAEYIEREAVKRLINNNFSGLLAAIDLIPVVDVVPVVHGHWIDGFIPDSMLCGCSECGFTCGVAAARRWMEVTTLNVERPAPCESALRGQQHQPID